MLTSSSVESPASVYLRDGSAIITRTVKMERMNTTIAVSRLFLWIVNTAARTFSLTLLLSQSSARLDPVSHLIPQTFYLLEILNHVKPNWMAGKLKSVSKMAEL